MLLTGVCVSALLLVAGCSLIGGRARPEPGDEVVHCALEYLPDEAGAGTDLRFFAWSSPYDAEQFNLSLPDLALHAAVAPGRHLVRDLTVAGAECEPGRWSKGFRLPAVPKGKKGISCRRRGLAEVSFEVETNFGACRATLEADDGRARPLHPRLLAILQAS